MTPDMMQAAVLESYGAVENLHVVSVPRPVPAADQVRIRVHATTVSAGDWRLRTVDVPAPVFKPMVKLLFGFKRPKNGILGTELAGEIESVGAQVTQFRPGQRVWAATGNFLGAHAQYIVLPQTAPIAPMPAALSYSEAASIPFGALTALFFLRDQAQLQRGQRLLIVGASGAVGVYAVQLAKYLGANVTAVCSTANLARMRELGADAVVDYSTQDYHTARQPYDAIFDTVGATNLDRCRSILNPKGVFLATVMRGREIWQSIWTPIFSSHVLKAGVSVESAANLEYLRSLVEAGAIRPVIDSRYPLQQIRQAHLRTESRRKVGSVVVEIP